MNDEELKVAKELLYHIDKVPYPEKPMMIDAYRSFMEACLLRKQIENS